MSLASTTRVTGGAYAERFIMPLEKAEVGKLPEARREFWSEFSEWLLTDRFLNAMIGKFEEHMRQRFGKDAASVRLESESLVVRDHTNYNLGPQGAVAALLLSR